MHKLWLYSILLFLLALGSNAQTVEFRELTPSFASNKAFKAIGEAVLKKPAGLIDFDKLTSAQRKKIEKKVLKDKNINRKKNIVIYVDVKNINYPDSKGLYFAWGYE